MTALLEVDGLESGYGDALVLRGVSLRARSDEIVSLIGPNGAGKSTLLRVICGLLPPRQGRVTFKGEPLARLRTDQILRRGICFVPQDRSLFPDMTVRENLRMGGYILEDRHEVERRLEAVFEMFPILHERSARPAKVLSGGEQQMLLLGRALVLEPQIIMLDEPSLGLAPKVARQIFDNMARLRTAGMTLLLVEQNARMGLEFADWGCVLDLGKLVFEGASHAVLEDPRIQELYLGRRRDFRPPGAPA